MEVAVLLLPSNGLSLTLPWKQLQMADGHTYIRQYLKACATDPASRLYDCCSVYRQPDTNGELLLSSSDGAAHGVCDCKRAVTHVVDLNNEADGGNTLPGVVCFEQQGPRVLDLASEDVSGVAREAVVFMQAALQDGGAVLVNCNFGVSRSAAVVLSLLMSLGQSLQEAWDQLVVNLNFGFWQQPCAIEEVGVWECQCH